MVGLSLYDGLLVFLLCGIAALIQGSAGIGFSMFVMAFAPMVMPYTLAANINRVTGLTVAVVGLWQYRHSIRSKKVAIPVLASLLTSILGVRMFQLVDEMVLKRALGIFLLVMVAVSLLLQRKKIILRANWFVGAIFGALAGFASGIFNVLGPILAVYYMAISENSREYRSSLNLSFVVLSLWINLLYQVQTGYTAAEWMYGLLGTVSCAIGLVISKSWTSSLDKEKVACMMYGIIAVMAICMLLI